MYERDANLEFAVAKTMPALRQEQILDKPRKDEARATPSADVFIDGMTLPPDPHVAELLHDFTVNQAHKAALSDDEHRRLDEARIGDLQDAKGCGHA